MDEFVNRPEEGIFARHRDYARWYTTQWALRIEDAIENTTPILSTPTEIHCNPFAAYAPEREQRAMRLNGLSHRITTGL